MSMLSQQNAFCLDCDRKNALEAKRIPRFEKGVTSVASPIYVVHYAKVLLVCLFFLSLEMLMVAHTHVCASVCFPTVAYSSLCECKHCQTARIDGCTGPKKSLLPSVVLTCDFLSFVCPPLPLILLCPHPALPAPTHSPSFLFVFVR